MIIDLITNNKRIVNYVQKTEGYGGKVEEKDGKYKLINVQIEYVNRFCEGLDEFIQNNDLPIDTHYTVIPPRAKNIEDLS